jgi:predicted transcriptional regulator
MVFGVKYIHLVECSQPLVTMDYENHTQLFQILSHPARLQILDILRAGEECVCHIQSLLGKRQAYVSQQLMVLREAVSEILGLVLGPAQTRACCEQATCPHCHSSCECQTVN